MTKSGEDYLNMTLTTTEVVDEFEAQWTTNVPFTNLRNEMAGNNNQLIDLQSQQDVNNTGITDDKKKKRSLLEQDDITISSVLSYYGSSVGDSNLQKQMNFASSAFSKMTELKLIGISDVIQKQGVANLKGAEPYQLTQQMLTDQNTHLQDFTKVLNAPRVATTATADATEQIAAVLDKQYKLIDERFDKAMMLYRGTEFYSRVQKARIIVDSPTHHLAMTGKFTDAAGNPVENVKITIVNGAEKVLRKSSPLGNIRVQNLLDGEHTMTVEKPGFATQVVTFIVAPPETVMVNVVMK